MKYGLALDLPGMPYGLDKTGVDEHMKQMQEVSECSGCEQADSAEQLELGGS